MRPVPHTRGGTFATVRIIAPLGAAFVSTALISIGACSGPTGGVEGFVDVSGSSTVEPISLIMAEDFNWLNRNWTYRVNGPGTTAGFEQFCNGETDVSDASRGIKDKEVESCAAKGIEPVELKIGIDGLAVIMSTRNNSVECLNFNDLYAIFGKESDEIRTWEEAAAFAAELGSTTTDWPNGDLAITAPGDESGTWGSFLEIALEDIQESRAEAGHEAAEGEAYTRAPGDIYVASPNDNVIIDGVGGNPSGIGFVGYAFASNNADSVRMVPIDGGNGECIAPTPETVAANQYPISRDLYIYVERGRTDPESASYNPALAPFLDFYLAETGRDLVSWAGYVPLALETLAETRATWEDLQADASS
jgi:phosphate transport system substrate-binding protein